MVAFYNQGDQAIYDSGQFFIPQEQYRLSYNAPIIEEEQESIGIPNTNSFKNFSNSDNRNFSNNSFQPYTAQPSGSFVTNRTDYGISGYIPGTEPEETFIDKAGNLIGRGIASFIPGGNFLMGMVNKLDRFDDLNAQDQAFTEMQMGINEQNIHGMGNLPNQDRYGYNKRSMFGNYGDLVSKRVQKAKDFFEERGYYRPIDNYYLQKEKEQDDIKNQIDFNNFIRQRTTANNIRNRIKNDPTYNEKFNIHIDQPSGGNGGGGAPPGFGITSAGNFVNQFEGGDPGQNQGGGNPTGSPGSKGAGGSDAMGSFRRGGLANL